MLCYFKSQNYFYFLFYLPLTDIFIEKICKPTNQVTVALLNSESKIKINNHIPNNPEVSGSYQKESFYHNLNSENDSSHESAMVILLEKKRFIQCS